MQPFDYQGKEATVHIRPVEHEDIPRLIALNKKAFPLMAEENVVWSERQLKNHLKIFPQGQLLAEVDGQIVGAVASLIISEYRDPYRAHVCGRHRRWLFSQSRFHGRHALWSRCVCRSRLPRLRHRRSALRSAPTLVQEPKLAPHPRRRAAGGLLRGRRLPHSRCLCPTSD